jgi:DNA-binding protein HU-beta
MNKTDLIDAVAGDVGLQKTDSAKAIESVLGHITKALKKGDKVTLVGFGTFAITERAARQGRNPRTGETIKIKASRGAKFTAGKELKQALNK